MTWNVIGGLILFPISLIVGFTCGRATAAGKPWGKRIFGAWLGVLAAWLVVNIVIAVR